MKKKTVYLFVVDDHGTPIFWLADKACFSRWDDDPNNLFEWLIAKERKGLTRFDTLQSLIDHVNANNLVVHAEAYSTPAY
jgi:hypothetical protein